MLSLFFLRVGYISTLSKAKYFVQIYRGNCLLFVLEDDSHTSFLVAGKPFFIGPICLQSELHIVNVEWLFSATFYNTLALFLWGGKWNTGTIAEKLCCICIDLWREFPRENYFKTPLKGCFSLFNYFIDMSPTLMSPFFVEKHAFDGKKHVIFDKK